MASRPGRAIARSGRLLALAASLLFAADAVAGQRVSGCERQADDSVGVSTAVLAYRPEPLLRSTRAPAPFAPVALAGFDPDTMQQRLFEYSDGYWARLSLHRVLSYGTLPLFVIQLIAGETLLRNLDDAPGWAEAIHGPAAGAIAGIFLVNTVTGVMNLIEGRHDANDRGRRALHGLIMLIADGGFIATGVTASGAGRYKADSNELRTTHRKVAYASMGVATIGYLMMIPPFRKD
jgi:hypothetical protein